MQNQRGRIPYGMKQQEIGTLVFGIAIIIIIYLVYQFFFKGGSYALRSSLATTSQIYQPSTYPTNNLNAYSYPSPSPSNIYDSSTFSSFDYSNQNSLTTSEKSDILTGYWILFDNNGVITQFNLNANDYAFIQRLIQNDNKGVPKIKIFLVENGRTRKYIVSNELYSIITNLNYILDSRNVNSSLNSSTNNFPYTSPNSYPNSSIPNSYPNSSNSNSSNSSNSNSTYNQGIKP
ncbi:hypothetical protein [Desulfosporosinus sp.]|uniref:hypothetical protein n=1 Tax=Desulfosporosinus sp. TaxID=157907 RepID=UPI002612577A|nr:hypothetical protein [Desulfosporosinus sp.]